MEKHKPLGENPASFIGQSSEDRRNIFSVLELFPIPMEVFSTDGMSLFVNQAFVDFFRIHEGEIIRRFNILNDPYINQKLGLSDYLRRAFAGEILSFHDLKVPFEEIDSRYTSVQGRPTESDIYQDIISFPLRGEDASVAYVVAVFMTKRMYQLRLDVMKAKKYIDIHWKDDFDIDKLAKVVGMSRHYLARLFKKTLGMPPYSYYQEVKIEKIKEALSDDSLNISQAFASCGAGYSSSFAEVFKNRVGMTPTQYKNALRISHESSEKPPLTLEQVKATQADSFCAIKNRLFQIAEIFPIPVQIFGPDGEIVFVNEATLKMWNVRDTSLIMGEYNLRRDPLVNDEFNLRDEIRRTFEGELVLIEDIRLPLESFWELYKTRSDAYDIEAIYTDILNFPVLAADGTLAYVVCIFFTSRVYNGRPEVAKSREYLENHWREEFDAAGLAQLVHLSPSQLSRLFKKHTGLTPYGYYQEIKINRLKEAMLDKTLSISEAFISCGFEYPGNSTRFFKEKTGMSPSEYRKKNEY
ncbi:MAG: helix-turn-helix domain-containing protein [Desulfitobacteriaceae bacterium]|nr:helix-turn-helix domain-containing protein [Desulfitobacteriaceae bacterium]